MLYLFPCASILKTLRFTSLDSSEAQAPNEFPWKEIGTFHLTLLGAGLELSRGKTFAEN